MPIDQGDRSRDSLDMSDHGPVPLIFPRKIVPTLRPTYTDPGVGICRAEGLYMSTLGSTPILLTM